ncbi:MAG TPA: glycosyltransferase [Solirubrobacter sp.]|nr:glycosyltransferase [Solirubrobacter sp.]
MRVLILPKWYPWPDRPVFGVFTREQARAAALHNDVRVLAFRPEPMRGLTLARTWEDDGVTRLIYRRPAWRPAAMATQLIGMERAIRAMRWRPQIIHAHVFEAGFPAILLARRFGARVVVSEHFTAFQRGLVRGMDLRLARFTFRHADLVCPVSEDLRAQLEAVEPRGRYRVVPNVVDTSIFHPGGERPPGRLRLLNVAALAEKKRHADLIDAVAGLDAELEIVGDGELRDQLERRAGPNVRFLGALPPEQVAERMRAADVFVLASEFENLPVVLLEALACGLPVVATGVGGVGEIVDESAGALVPPHDVAALRAAISDVAARTFDREALAARARERYGMEAIARTWDEIYAAL